MTRAAVIGCGDVSVVHTEAIRAIDGAELVAVCDTDPDRLAAVATTYGVPGFSDHVALLDEVRPDVVHIATPHDQHVQISIDALERGVEVIQEKPLAHSLSEGRRLVEAAASSGTRIGVCFQNRYNVSSQQARRLIDEGALGAIRGAYATVVWTRTADYYAARPWRGTWANSGGGLLINQAIHTIDLVQWLLGGVEAVQGHAAARKFDGVIEVEDTAEALITHTSGATTSFYATLTSTGQRAVELEIFGEDATLRIGRGGLDLDRADGTSEHWDERQAPTGGRAYWGVSHELLIRDFYASRGGTGPFWISPAEALVSLDVLKTVYSQSSDSLPGYPGD
jgi:UDP-N-acetyl-2-amino-2-deoxyglucuronate dehydrogenase